MIGPSRQPLPTQHPTNTRYELAYYQRDTNPLSPSIKPPQSYVLDRPATGIGQKISYSQVHCPVDISDFSSYLTRRLKMAGAILPRVINEWYVVEDGYILTYLTI
jgi:hypothetical protein